MFNGKIRIGCGGDDTISSEKPDPFQQGLIIGKTDVRLCRAIPLSTQGTEMFQEALSVYYRAYPFTAEFEESSCFC